MAAETPPQYSRPPSPSPSAFDGFEVRARLLLKLPTMPASVIAERRGWARSPSWFRKRVAVLRPEHRPKNETDRLEHGLGDQGQCDLWFPQVKI